MSNSHLFLKSGFVSAPLQNGVGRYVCQLQRIVIKFCKNHGASRGVRDFVENDLIHYATKNPGVAVYLKPRRHRAPVLVGEYLNGDRQWLSMRNKSVEEVNAWIKILTTAQDASGIRYRKMQYTDNPSIQGVWTPKHNLIGKDRLEQTLPSPAMDKIKQLAIEQGIIKE